MELLSKTDRALSKNMTRKMWHYLLGLLRGLLHVGFVESFPYKKPASLIQNITGFAVSNPFIVEGLQLKV